MSFMNKLKDNGLTIAIVIVAILLAVSVLLLIFVPRSSGSSSSNGNLIQNQTSPAETSPSSGNSETSSNESTVKPPVISFKNVNSSEEKKLAAANMFPGDTVSGIYELVLEDDGIAAVSFSAKLKNEAKSEYKLSDVLDIKISANGELLFQGLAKDLPSSLWVETSETSRSIDFEFSATLSTSVGNEYQGKQLTFDLAWWIDEEDFAPASPAETTTESTSPTSPAETTASTTPVATDEEAACVWCWIAPISAVTILGVALVVGRKKIASLFKKNGT